MDQINEDADGTDATEVQPRKTRVTSEARILQNRISAQKSTGPRTRAGKARSSMNARKHGLYAERDRLVREESMHYEDRLRRWSATTDAQNDLEEFLVNEQVSLSFEIEHTRSARIEARETRIENAEADALARVRDLGSRLYLHPLGPAELYGHQTQGRKTRTSSNAEAVDPNDPAKIVDEIARTAVGCRWLLDELYSLRDNLEPDKFWTGGDRLKAVRLLGRQTTHAADDRRVADILAASNALHRTGKTFDCLRSDMGTDAHENFVKELRTKWTDLVRPEEKDKAPQILIYLVDTHIEQIEEILQARDAQSPETQARREVTRLNFDHNPEGELMRTYERRCHSTLLRGLEVLKKVRGKKKTERDEPPRYERRVPIPKDYGRAGHRSTRVNDSGKGGGMTADVDLSWAHEDATQTAGDVGAGRSDEVPVGSGWRDPEIDTSGVLTCGGLISERCR